MAVTLGTNSGFVTEAPVDDPLSSSRSQIDNNKIATYDTSPELAELITEIGWWCDTATEEADFQVALYSNNSGAPYTRLYYSTASAKGTSDGWKVIDGLNWEITASTGYWIVVSCADTSSTTYVDWYSSGGSGVYSTYGSPSLTNPWQYGSGDADAKAAIYAVWKTANATNSPGTCANDDAVGTNSWTNPDNAKASDDSYVTAPTGGSYEQTYYLKASNFGFSIPEGATIDGILVEVERKKDVGVLGAYDVEVKIVKSDGSIGSENKADISTNWPTSDAYASYGASDDLWSESWDYSDINNSNFGMVISAKGRNFDTPNDIYLDHIQITVYYTEGGAPATQINSILTLIAGGGKVEEGPETCFIAGTKIIMEDNTTKNIEDVKVGDMILSLNEKTQKIEPQKVISTRIIGEENGYYLINNNLGAVGDQPLMTNNGWVRADKLKKGDMLVDINNNLIKVNKIDKKEKEFLSYDLTINLTHNYFANNILAHNPICP